MKTRLKEYDRLESYLLFLIRKSKLLDAKTILFKVRHEYGEHPQYDELRVPA